jgi:hypothetical protein
MDSALGNSASKKKHPRTKNKPSDRQDGRNSSPTPVGRKQRVKGANNKAAIAEPSPDALDMSSMSRSLPASFFAENQHANGKVDPAKWDMPAPTGGQELNWQQQLRAADTPKRSPRSQPVDGNSRRRNKQADAAPRQHDRHQSLEDVPVSNLTKMMASVGPHSASANGVPHSAFDSSIPFHTGFNVHRAPQTPVRTAGLRSTSSSRSPAGAISLPIVGEFPRINKSGAPLGGQKYAGPTFHNSPASGSLPQPDLDDF